MVLYNSLSLLFLEGALRKPFLAESSVIGNINPMM